MKTSTNRLMIFDYLEAFNIYNKKKWWKLWLAIAALCIVVISSWYVYRIVQDIADDERERVALWAKAISKKAKFVRYTGHLFAKIGEEEEKRVRLWAEANKRITREDLPSDLSFYLEIIASNTTIPVLVVDEHGQITNSRNFENTDSVTLYRELKAIQQQRAPIILPVYGNKKNYLYYKDSKIFFELKQTLEDLTRSFMSEVVLNSASVPVVYTDSEKEKVLESGNVVVPEGQDSTLFFADLLEEMKGQNRPIEVELDEGNIHYIYYSDSVILQKITYYPFFLFLILALFLAVAYSLFSTARKSEQNQVWVGMAKETAHQLGTPLSSLMAWVEYLKGLEIDPSIPMELDKDVARLSTITERFSKIGAAPKLELKNVYAEINSIVKYLQNRISDYVSIDMHQQISKDVAAQLNPALFGWVLENIIKNAVDAMKGKGKIEINIIDQSQVVYIDISDTGKGVDPKLYKRIFEPGYTSKKRGWGLGLSLVKRIVVNYHSGNVFVKSSSPQGTIFRIVLNK